MAQGDGPRPDRMSGEPDDDIPRLDPATERVRRRLIRLMVVSVGITLVGVLAVFAIVILRSSPDRDFTPTATDELRTIALPASARVLASSLSGDAILLRVSQSEGERLYVISRRTGETIETYRIRRGGPPPGDEP